MISYSLMFHPKRIEYLEYLQGILGDVPVSMDDDNNIWTTCKKAWELHDPEADYHCVLQDDLILTSDFKAKVDALVEGDYVYSLYLGNRRKFRSDVERAKRNKSSYIEKPNIYHECALIFPTHRISEMLDYCQKRNPDTDKVINNYVRDSKLTVRIATPSLVQHRMIASLHNGNKSQMHTRTAIWFEP